jgi:NADP-dependent 3-hydroxy acid dehydrogenase YdfG
LCKQIDLPLISLEKVDNMSTRIAVVAGAGSGLGQATALTLHAAGLTVVAVDRSEGGLKELPDGIHREVADATDPGAAGPLMDRIVTEVGSPDILVNTVGAYDLRGTDRAGARLFG